MKDCYLFLLLYTLSVCVPAQTKEMTETYKMRISDGDTVMKLVSRDWFRKDSVKYREARNA